MKVNVGICVLIREGENIWKNGILQNCIFFYDLLEKISIVDKVSFIQVSSTILSEKHALSNYNFEYMNEGTLQDVSDNYDLLLSLGALPATEWINVFKENPNNRFVQYKGGNEFFNEIEGVLYGQYLGWPNVKLGRGRYEHSQTDEVWMVPQQELHNLHYSEIKHKCKARVTPFVWSPKFIEEAGESFKKDDEITPYFHEKTFDKWTFASFEPNMSVLKNMVPLLYAAEHAYTSYPYVKENLDTFIMTNAAGFHENESLVNLANDLILKREHKVAFDGRYPTPYVISKYAQGVISHQWGNALNYAYLDICYFGIPLIHNAHLCKDLGYYYEDWKLLDLAKLINDVMENHPRHDEQFMLDQRKKLNRYTTNNEDMVKHYELLIANLWEKNEVDNSTYDWSTNLLKY